MVTGRNQPRKHQLDAPFVKVGSFYPKRENFRLTPEVKATFTGKLALNPRDSCGRKVKDKDVVRIDGLKLVCDNGSWLCYPFPAPSRI
jgi:phosphoglucomutase